MTSFSIPVAYNRTGQRIGGINRNDEPVGFNGQFSPYMKNFVVESSYIRKRLGYSPVGTNLPLDGVGTGLCKYVDSRGVSHLIATTTTKAYEYDAALDEWFDISPAAARSTITPDGFDITTPDGQSIIVSESETNTAFSGATSDRFRFSVATDTEMFTNNGGSALIISNSVNDLYYYEGHSGDTVKTLVHGFPSFASCTDICEFWNHFFVFNFNNGDNNVRSLAFAGLGDIDSWSGGTSGATTLTDSIGAIKRAVKLGSDVVIYSDESVSLCRYIGGTTIFTIPTLIFGTGLLGPDAVCQFTDYHVFIGSDQRIHKYTGSNRTEDIGSRIDSAFFSELDYAYKDRIVAGYDQQRKKLYVFIPTASSSNPKFAYVISPSMYGAPWEYHEFSDSVCAFATLSATSDVYCDSTEWADRYSDEVFTYCDDSYSQETAPICVFLSDNGYVYKLDESTGQDYDSDIECEYQTEDITLDEEETFTRWDWVSFVANSASGCDLYISYSIDDGLTFTDLIDSPSAITSGWNTYRLPLDVASRKIRFRFYDKSSNDIKLRESVKVGYTVQTERD